MTRTPRLALALALLTLSACSPGGTGSGAASTVEVAGAICRPTPVGRQMTGCYLTLTTTTADRLVSVASPAANLVQIHESRIESGMMMMNELKEGLPLPAGETVALAPGGNHLMLLGVKEPLVAGDTVALTLTFEASPPVEVTATVGQPAVPQGEAASAADAG
jgi:copper(I)-binding protein